MCPHFTYNLAAQEPYRKTQPGDFCENFWQFFWKLARRKKGQDGGRGLCRKTREEMEKGSQITAQRFETGRGHKTSHAIWVYFFIFIVDSVFIFLF